MGLGRKQFFKLASLALAGVIIDPFQAVITSNDLYVNKKLGIIFSKPQGWGFLNVKQFGKLKNDQILQDGWNENKEEVWKDLGDPICIATKYYEDLPKYKGIFSPTITMNITHKSEIENEDDIFEDILGMSAYGTSLLLKEFNVVKQYEPYDISGSKFYEYDAEYLFEHEEIDAPLKVELKTLKTKHNDYYYDFNCHQSLAQNQVAAKEFIDFKNSIKLI